THRGAQGRLLIVKAGDHVDMAAAQGFVPVTSASRELSAEERLFAVAFEDMLARKASGFVPDGDGLSWSTPGRHAPIAVPLADEARALLPAAPTSAYLIGSVCIGLTIVSGPDKLAFSDKERTKVLSEVIEATNFLIDANPSGRVTFDLVTQHVVIATPPNADCTGECATSGFESCEAVWRNPAMAQLGYSPDWAGVIDYAVRLHEL